MGESLPSDGKGSTDKGKGVKKDLAVKLPPVERNEGVSKKMAKSVAASIETYRLKEFGNDPIATPCQWLLVSSVNRMGQCLTLAVVWQIAMSLMDDGCDPDRTGLGICVWFKRQETKLKAIRHNLQKFGGSPLYPPIEEEDVKGKTLAASHLQYRPSLLPRGHEDGERPCPRR